MHALKHLAYVPALACAVGIFERIAVAIRVSIKGLEDVKAGRIDVAFETVVTREIADIEDPWV